MGRTQPGLGCEDYTALLEAWTGAHAAATEQQRGTGPLCVIDQQVCGMRLTASFVAHCLIGRRQNATRSRSLVDHVNMRTDHMFEFFSKICEAVDSFVSDVFGNTTSHSLGVALHSGSGGLC